MSKETNQAYHSDMSRVSNSMLTVLKRSPKEFAKRFILRTWIEADSKPLKIGQLVHCLTLEPSDFDSRYVIGEKCDKRTKAGKAAWAELEANANCREIVDAEDYDLAKQCALELMNHDEFGLLLMAPPKDAVIEERIDFEWNGVPARCKPDMVIPSMNVIIDIKTTQDASEDAFKRAIGKWGYHRQDAFYKEAVRQKYGRDFRFLFAVVATNQTMETACYELRPKSVSRARTELNALINDYERRKIDNNWNAVYSRGIVPMELPNYYDSNILVDEDEEMEGVAA